eukprot:3265140-Karenia_brevis.AAC.1
MAKALGTLKKGPGQWESLFAPAVGGGQTKLFLGPDQNGRQIRVSSILKKLVMVLKQALPDEQFFINKSRGTISHSWKEFVQ